MDHAGSEQHPWCTARNEIGCPAAALPDALDGAVVVHHLHAAPADHLVELDVAPLHRAESVLVADVPGAVVDHVRHPVAAEVDEVKVLRALPVGIVPAGGIELDDAVRAHGPDAQLAKPCTAVRRRDRLPLPPSAGCPGSGTASDRRNPADLRSPARARSAFARPVETAGVEPAGRRLSPRRLFPSRRRAGAGGDDDAHGASAEGG